MPSSHPSLGVSVFFLSFFLSMKAASRNSWGPCGGPPCPERHGCHSGVFRVSTESMSPGRSRDRDCANQKIRAFFRGGYPFGAGSALTLLELPASGRSRHGRACEAPVPPVQPMLSPLPRSRLARHLASPQGSSLAPAASLCRSPAPAPPTSCTATRDAPPSRTACIRYSRRAFATTWIACHCKRARSRAVKVCRAG